ncbi:unnamed protein product [Prunus armeniaca]|uniref:Calcineurin B-like protein n=1 Tax=Prunus armeniaca TaxID=36596 RepID=A0A6J5Y8L2_PRUAR|nr:unnamed protein product [Prunus armeniaca]
MFVSPMKPDEEFQLALFRTPYGENLFLDRKNGVFEFDEFVHALNVFHPYASADDKIVVKQMVIAIMMESDLKLSNDLLESIIDNCTEIRWRRVVRTAP